MTGLEIASVAVTAFGLFSFGYALGWCHRDRLAQLLPSREFLDSDVEMRARRHQ